MPAANDKRFGEMPIWAGILAVIFIGGACVALSYYPVARRDHRVSSLFFYSGMLVGVAGILSAVVWLRGIMRGDIPPSELNKSAEQINRDLEETLERARKVLERESRGGQ